MQNHRYLILTRQTALKIQNSQGNLLKYVFTPHVINNKAQLKVVYSAGKKHPDWLHI